MEFDAFSDLEVRKLAHLQVAHREMYQQDAARTEYPHGPVDPRMGTGTKGGVCGTCNEKAISCVGHFGYVDFCVPIFHFGFFKTILFTLQLICKVIMIKIEQKNIYIKISNPFFVIEM